MLTRLTLTTLASTVLLTLTACDKDESLGEVTESQGSAGESDTDDVSCPTDAMICPDGTAVGREGPACEFAPCPGDTDGESESESGVSCPTDAMICPDGTTVGREGPDCEFVPCPDGVETDGGETDGGETDGGETDGDDQACPPNAVYYSPATCPNDDIPPITEGCYEVCEKGGSGCAIDHFCQSIEINPCDCPQGENCCAACASDVTACMPVLRGDACQGLLGGWQSVDELECGPPDAPVLCNWELEFQNTGDYNWAFADATVDATFHCIEGAIYVQGETDVFASYDADNDLLQWDGETYERAK